MKNKKRNTSVTKQGEKLKPLTVLADQSLTAVRGGIKDVNEPDGNGGGGRGH